MNSCHYVLFDLDGTLIDSAPAIVASYRDAFAAIGHPPVTAIDASIIGPPLLETVRLLSGSDDPALITALAESFKHSYDHSGYRHTRAYAEVAEMLTQLRAAGLRLAIATNKRLHPTRLILELLGWQDFFAAVYALDLPSPPFADKAAMIRHLLADLAIAPDTAVYVGDRAEDGYAADANKLPFIAANWGYGSLQTAELAAHWRQASTPAQITSMLLPG